MSCRTQEVAKHFRYNKARARKLAVLRELIQGPRPRGERRSMQGENSVRPPARVLQQPAEALLADDVTDLQVGGLWGWLAHQRSGRTSSPSRCRRSRALATLL